MKSVDDFPSLYKEADRSSRRLQAQFFGLLLFNLAALVFAGAMSSFPQKVAWWWICSGLLACAAVVATVSSIFLKPQSRWYRTRAIAESVKTMSWRYALRAEPFDSSDQAARLLLADRIGLLLSQHKEIAGDFVPSPGATQVTGEMDNVRQMGLGGRLNLYLTERVQDQQDWYSRRASEHRRKLGLVVGATVLMLLIAVGLMFYRAAYPKDDVPYTDIALSMSLALLAWVQAKRYPETIASYSLTAHEIGLIRVRADAVVDEPSLSKFIGDAENAFSREHTQWVARLDSP